MRPTKERLAEIRAAEFEDGKRCGVPELLAEIDALTRERDRALEDGIHGVIYIRCIAHRAVCQQNAAEITGAECGACIAAERDRLAAQVAALREASRALDHRVSTWIGLEAPRVDTAGPQWRELEIARAALRRVLAETVPAADTKEEP